jgi:hypothetical protein
MHGKRRQKINSKIELFFVLMFELRMNFYTTINDIEKDIKYLYDLSYRVSFLKYENRFREQWKLYEMSYDLGIVSLRKDLRSLLCELCIFSQSLLLKYWTGKIENIDRNIQYFKDLNELILLVGDFISRVVSGTVSSLVKSNYTEMFKTTLELMHKLRLYNTDINTV